MTSRISSTCFDNYVARLLDGHGRTIANRRPVGNSRNPAYGRLRDTPEERCLQRSRLHRRRLPTDRLAELGVSEIFGVPGDYNLQFLDHIVAHPTIRWVGSANELNAGYAADGYGRLRGMSAVVTTFGVGELGDQCDRGQLRRACASGAHCWRPDQRRPGHSPGIASFLGDGDFEHFLRISREITCAQANLMPATAGREIDRVLSEVREQKRPGYILLSSDVARFPTEPPAAPLPRYPGGTSPRALSLFTKAAIELIADHQLTVLADLLVHRLQAVKELEALLAADVVPHATLMWEEPARRELAELPGNLRRRGQRRTGAPRSKGRRCW